MSNTTLKIIVFSVLCLMWTLVLYLAFSFIAWQFNPGEWDLAGRFMYIIFWGFGMAAAVIGVMEAK